MIRFTAALKLTLSEHCECYSQMAMEWNEVGRGRPFGETRMTLSNRALQNSNVHRLPRIHSPSNNNYLVV